MKIIGESLKTTAKKTTDERTLIGISSTTHYMGGKINGSPPQYPQIETSTKIDAIKKIDFKRGSASSIAFIYSVIIFLLLLVFLCNMFITCITKEKISDALLTIGHDIIACENIEDAREMAAEEAEYYLGGDSHIDVDSIYTDVQYDTTKGSEWKKGNYVYLTLSVKYRHMGFRMQTKEFTNLVMIERG